MTTPTTPAATTPAATTPAAPVVITETPAATPETKPAETKPTGNWPWVSSVWPNDSDGLLAKIVKIAICLITLPLAGLMDVLAKCYNWITTKPEDETNENKETTETTETPEATETPETPETPEAPAPQPGTFARLVSYIKDPKVAIGTAIGIAAPYVWSYAAKPLACALPIIGRACL